MKKTFSSIAACSVVAKHLIASVAEEEAPMMWDAYPDIGEEDWEEVVAAVKRQATYPDGITYRDAYNILKSRTTKEA